MHCCLFLRAGGDEYDLEWEPRLVLCKVEKKSQRIEPGPDQFWIGGQKKGVETERKDAEILPFKY